MPRRTYVIRLNNWHPTKLNELMNAHWAVRKRKKDFDANCIAFGVAAADVPKAECPRKVKLEIVLGPGERGGDPDCYWKSLLDGLVRCGALVDDSKTWCIPDSVVFLRGPRRSTVVILENLQVVHGNKTAAEAREEMHRYRAILPGQRRNLGKITSPNDV